MRINIQKLNKRLLPLAVAFVLLLGVCCPIFASAASWNDPIDYRDLDYKVTYGTDYNKVVVPLPVSHYYMAAYDMPPLGDGGMIGESFGTDSFTYNYVKGRNYRIFAYPGGWRGFSLDGMPSGTRLHFDLLLTVHSSKDLVIAGNLDLFERSYYLVNGEWKDINNELVTDLYGWGMPISLDFTVDGYNGASSFVCGAMIEHFSAYDYAEVTIVMSNVRLEMDVSVDYWTQWQNEQNGKMLGDIKDSIEDSTDEITGAIDGSTDKITDAIQDSTSEINTSIDKGVNNILEGNEYLDDIAGESNKEMSAAADKLNGLGDQLSAVEKPDLGDMQVGINDLIGDSSSLVLLTSPIREIWQNPVALGFITIVLTLVLVSWVFFGKK